MKRKLTAAVIGAAMAVSAMVCPVPAMAAGEQVLNTYRLNEPATLDRVAPTIDESGKYILYDASEPLVRIEEGKITEAGCESYEYNEADLTYTFKLRENYWEDGVQVTAADYLYSFQRMVDPDSAYGYVSDLYCIENAEAINAGEMEVSELGVTAPDDTTLVVKLNEVTPSFLQVVPMYPQRQDFVEECGDSYGIDADKFLSCGPFKVTAWEHNSYIDMVPNDQYWDAANVKLEQLHVAFVNDPNTLYSSMLNGTLDYMETSTPEYIETFESMDDMVVQDHVTPTLGFIVFNCEDELMSNAKVRQAFSLAINREMFTEVIYHGLSYPAYGLLSPANGIDGVSFRDKVEEPLKAFAEENPDPKELLIEGLTELGMDPDPSKLQVTLSTGSTSASSNNSMAVFQQFFQETLGVTMVPDATEWATFWNDCKGGDFQMAYLAWSGEVDVSFLFNLFLSDSAQMPCFYYTDEFDEIVEKANKSTDAEERFQLYGEAEKLVIVDQCQLAPVYYSVNRSVLRSRVKNWDYNVFSTAGRKGVYIEE
ncbi:MAG: peptide ABC transporter substrate-binding protein [Lachnospiraceae bacterium]|nr:peptide ABC transporter substrate-binding protein [Lachnospiraceae bacterium]